MHYLYLAVPRIFSWQVNNIVKTPTHNELLYSPYRCWAEHNITMLDNYENEIEENKLKSRMMMTWIFSSVKQISWLREGGQKKFTEFGLMFSSCWLNCNCRSVLSLCLRTALIFTSRYGFTFSNSLLRMIVLLTFIP